MAAPANVTYSGGTPTGFSPTEWRPASQFVLRLAGFEFELLQRLAFEQTLERLQAPSDSQGLKRCFDDELQSKRRVLWEIAGRPDFLEALLLSNPAVCDRVESYVKHPFPVTPNSAQARIERVIATYLQRFCAKNDTSSFFGPVTYGTVTATTGLQAKPSGRLAERKVRISHWAADAIRHQLTGSNEPIPTQTWEPLAFLPESSCFPDVNKLKVLLRAFQAADYGRRKQLLPEIDSVFTSITGQAPYRNQGVPYGDRMVVGEECRYDAGCLHLGPSAIKLLTEDCSVLFDVIAYPGRLRMALEREAFKNLIERVWGKNAAIPYAEVLEYLRETPDAGRTAREEARAAWQQRIVPYLAAVHGLLAGCEHQRILHLSPDALQRIKGTACDGIDDWPFFCSPDVLLAAPSLDVAAQGDYSMVLGEVHSSIGINGYYASVHEDKEMLRKELVSALAELAGARQPVAFVTPAFNKTLSDLHLPFPALEQGGTAMPGNRVISTADLVIRIAGGVPELMDAQSGPVFLYSKMPWTMGLYPLCLFGVAPCNMTEFKRAILFGRNHIPRIQLGRMTVMRETWMAERKEMMMLLSGEPLDAFCRMRERAQSEGWPRHIFVRWDTEEKPIFVDLASWLLLNVLKYRLSRSSAQSIEVSEMLPASNDLWLRDKAGSHTSEFRLLMYQRRSRPELS